MRKIVFAQRGIAGITHTTLVEKDRYANWLAYAGRKGHIILSDVLA